MSTTLFTWIPWTLLLSTVIIYYILPNKKAVTNTATDNTQSSQSGVKKNKKRNKKKKSSESKVSVVSKDKVESKEVGGIGMTETVSEERKQVNSSDSEEEMVKGPSVLILKKPSVSQDEQGWTQPSSMYFILPPLCIQC